MKKIISLLIRNVPRKYLQLVSGVGLKVVGWFYAGNAVTCPVCKSRYKSFLPYGRINPRSNALCPSCLSLERHRLIWLFLQNETNFLSQKLRVLHVAPEPCFMKRFEKIHGEDYITADIESPLAKVKMDIHQIPFDDNEFDVVLCNHVLEHVENDILAMSEIHRVLRKNGWAIMQVPFFSPVPEVTYEDKSITDPREREKAFGQDDHVRKFGKDYLQRIAKSGLTPEANEFAKKMTPEECFGFGISRNEIIYRGIKTR